MPTGDIKSENPRKQTNLQSILTPPFPLTHSDLNSKRPSLAPINKSKFSNNSEVIHSSRILGAKQNIKSAQILNRQPQYLESLKHKKEFILNSEIIPSLRVDSKGQHERFNNKDARLNQSESIKKGSKIWSNLRYQQLESDEEQSRQDEQSMQIPVKVSICHLSQPQIDGI